MIDENKYYNSKYIDAEETDVSRNQTSTWLIEMTDVDEARYTMHSVK